MKKKIIKYSYVFWVLLLNVFLSIFISLLIEKIVYPYEAIIIKRFLLSTFSFIFFLSVFSFVILQKKNILSVVKKKCDYLTGLIIRKSFLIKYLFSFFITLIATFLHHEVNYILFGISELTIIFFVTDAFIEKNNKISKVLNIILLLLYNINSIVLVFGSSFISMIMLTNIDFIKDLAGKALIYVIGIFFVLLFTMWPVHKVKHRHSIKYLVGVFVYEICLFLLLGWDYSPLGNYIVLAKKEYRYISMQIALNRLNLNKDVFLNNSINDYAHYKLNFKDKPNIILIMTEGLSYHIIEDERNIMPNLKEFGNNSIKFVNYYNHTAATFRGIIGQLYSGYQNDNLDTNELVSLQSILSNNNYSTAFLNTEPDMELFYEYLTGLGYDNVINEYNPNSNYLSDKQAYKQLYNNAIKYNKKSNPFFLTIYTFGTHATFDSPDMVYGDGTNSLMNKFYNLDYQFHSFMEKFKKSPLYNNTIIVFTTDHSTYADIDYTTTFPNRDKKDYLFMDEIPLFIYYKGVKSEVIDANGRNSLDLAPTILDFLDISEPNYFLGESLFSGKDGGTMYDSYYYENTTFLGSKNDNPYILDENDPMIF